MAEEHRPASEWRTTARFKTEEPLSPARLRGRVVLLHAFQMLCPGCVARGLPQAKRVAELFGGAPVAVVGLHTVFEHHEVMGPEALRAFLQRGVLSICVRQWLLAADLRYREATANLAGQPIGDLGMSRHSFNSARGRITPE